jgi:hypothetical protein
MGVLREEIAEREKKLEEDKRVFASTRSALTARETNLEASQVEFTHALTAVCHPASNVLPCSCVCVVCACICACPCACMCACGCVPVVLSRGCPSHTNRFIHTWRHVVDCIVMIDQAHRELEEKSSALQSLSRNFHAADSERAALASQLSQQKTLFKQEQQQSAAVQHELNDRIAHSSTQLDQVRVQLAQSKAQVDALQQSLTQLQTATASAAAAGIVDAGQLRV